jgi:hypothetical protein
LENGFGGGFGHCGLGIDGLAKPIEEKTCLEEPPIAKVRSIIEN